MENSNSTTDKNASLSYISCAANSFNFNLKILPLLPQQQTVGLFFIGTVNIWVIFVNLCTSYYSHNDVTAWTVNLLIKSIVNDDVCCNIKLHKFLKLYIYTILDLKSLMADLEFMTWNFFLLNNKMEKPIKKCKHFLYLLLMFTQSDKGI